MSVTESELPLVPHFHLLSPDAKFPETNPNDLFLDVYAAHQCYIAPNDVGIISIDLQIIPPRGHVALMQCSVHLLCRKCTLIADTLQDPFMPNVTVYILNSSANTVCISRHEVVAQLFFVPAYAESSNYRVTRSY